MTQKVIKIGTSMGVTIPKRTVEEFNLKSGDEVEVTFKPVRNAAVSDEQSRIARLTLRFIDTYRKDLEALANE